MNASQALRAVSLVFLFGALTACGGYRLEGVVQRGPYGDAFFTEPSSRAIEEGTGIAGAQIRLHRDAGRPNQRLVASARSDDEGRIVLNLDQFGAGWMEEEWLIQISRSGFETVERVFTLPSARRGRILLVTMVEGTSLPPGAGRTDLLEEFERFRR